MAGVKKLPASATFPEVALLLCWLALLLCWQAGQDKLGSSTHSPHLMCARTCARLCARICVIFLDAHAIAMVNAPAAKISSDQALICLIKAHQLIFLILRSLLECSIDVIFASLN